MKKAFSELDRLGKSARLLLLDVAIRQGAGGAVDLDDADEAAVRELDQRGYVEGFLPEPRAEWNGSRSGRRTGRITQHGQNWLQGALQAGRWRLTEADERGRWDKALAALRKGGTVWTAPVPEVLKPSAEWGQTALADAAEDAKIAARVAVLFSSGVNRAGQLDRLIAAAPAAGAERRAWLERADEIATAWGKPLFGPGAWLPNHSPTTCPVVDIRPGTWKPTQINPETRRTPARA